MTSNDIRSLDQYCIINIDRWPIDQYNVDGKLIFIGQYGSTYICDENGRVYEIESFDKEKRQILTKTKRTFRLVNEPDYELFMKVIGNEWDTSGKYIWINDEDKTDYVPYYYKTINDYVNEKPTQHNPYKSFDNELSDNPQKENKNENDKLHNSHKSNKFMNFIHSFFHYKG